MRRPRNAPHWLVGGLWIASAFADWFTGAVDPEFLKIAGLTATAATLLLKSLKNTLTYAKESWQYIQTNAAAFDPDKYAIDILIFFLGIAILATAAVGHDEAPVKRFHVAAATAPPSGSFDPVLFFPTFHFASAIPVKAGGVEVEPGLQIRRESVEPSTEHLQKLHEFALRLLTCSKRDDPGTKTIFRVIGFASDTKFFDVAGAVHPDSDRLNLTVANLRATNTARALNRTVAKEEVAPTVTFEPIPWPISDISASIQQMNDQREQYDKRLEFAFNSSIDHRAAIVQMNDGGNVCLAQAYQPHYRALSAR